MSFDLHPSFRTVVSFLYRVKDSNNCFNDSILKVLSPALIFFADYFCYIGNNFVFKVY